MKPVDFRNETWEQVRERLGESLMAVWRAWQAHGPGTTRAVAEKSGIDLLTFRPRTTDLFNIGMMKVVGDGETVHRRMREGIYAAATEDEVREVFRKAKAHCEVIQQQLQLK